MPNTPSSSFIPKQGPAKRSRQIVSRQVHVFTVLSYVLFFGALTASAGVFLYSKHIDTQLENEITALDTAIANFSDEKMEQVKGFNTRLLQAKDRINNSVSAVSIFESLEASTAQVVSLESLTLKRIEDETFLLTAKVNTDDFDSVLFQRGLYERNSMIQSVAFEDVSLGTTDSEEGDTGSGVSFEAELKVPLSAVPYKPDGTPVPLTDNTVFEVGSTTTQNASSTSQLPSNQTGV